MALVVSPYVARMGWVTYCGLPGDPKEAPTCVRWSLPALSSFGKKVTRNLPPFPSVPHVPAFRRKRRTPFPPEVKLSERSFTSGGGRAFRRKRQRFPKEATFF